MACSDTKEAESADVTPDAESTNADTAVVTADAPNPDPNDDATLPATSTQVTKVWPSDTEGIVVPAVTPTFVTPAWELGFLKNYTNGFSLQPRISIQFSDDGLDIGTFTSDNVYLREKGTEARRTITQRIWNPASRTMYFLPRRYLAEHTTYEIITSSALTAGGKAIPATAT